ncbi:MAG: hypothetical protein ACREFP_02210 [Acetobacteraceae bacterium]
MPQSVTPLMSLTSPDQTAVIIADFGPILPNGVTLVAASFVSMTVWPAPEFPAQDQNPSSRILGAPVVVPSPYTRTQNAAIAQMVGHLQPDVRYAIQIAGFATDGSEPELWQYLTADYPGMLGP